MLINKAQLSPYHFMVISSSFEALLLTTSTMAKIHDVRVLDLQEEEVLELLSAVVGGPNFLGLPTGLIHPWIIDRPV
jgi:hypothetical protein